MAASARRKIHRGISRPGAPWRESNNQRITFPGLRSIISQTRIAIPRCYVMPRYRIPREMSSFRDGPIQTEEVTESDPGLIRSLQHHQLGSGLCMLLLRPLRLCQLLDDILIPVS